MEAKRELEINILLLAKFLTKRNKSTMEMEKEYK